MRDNGTSSLVDSDAKISIQISTGQNIGDIGFWKKEIRGIKMDVCAVEVLDDVLVFLDRLRDLAILKGDDIVRSNIHASPIRGSALAWYSTELTDFERSSLRHMPLEEGWFKMLRQRFKMRPSMALAKLTEATYTPADVRAGKSVRSFAQSIFRYALAASIFNQITQA